MAQGQSNPRRAKGVLPSSDPIAALSILDALSSNLAIMDEEGVIVYVNRAWRLFAETNPPLSSNVNEGANYLEVCDLAQGPDAKEAAEMAAGIRAVLRGEREEFTLEYPCHSPGQRRWFVARVTRFVENGENHAVIAHENVTAQKIEELQIQESELRIRAMFALSERREQERALLDRVRTTLADELDLTTILRTVVEAIVETFGYTLVSLYLLHDDRLILQHQVGYSTVIPEIPISEGVSGRVVRTGQPLLIEDARADPSFLGAMEEIVSEVCVPLGIEGRVIGILNVESFRGVTLTQADLTLMTALSETVSVAIERARLYTQVHEEKQRYRKFIDHAPEAIYIYHADTRMLHEANPAFLNLLGYSLEEARTLSLYDIVAHEQKEINGLFEKILKQGAAVLGERKWRRKDGSLVDVHVTVSAAQQAGKTYLLVQGLDITERKRAENALFESERKFYRLIAESADGILLTDEAGVIIEFNNAMEGISNLRRDEVMGQFVWDMQFKIAPGPLRTEETYHRMRDILQKALETGQASFFDRIVESQFERTDGSLRIVQQRAFSIRTDKGWRLGNISRDVTEQQKTADALIASEAELRALFASMQDTVLVIDRQGIYRKIAPTHPGKFYIPPEKVIGKHLSDLFSQASADRFLAVIQQVLETRQTLQVDYEIPINGQSPWFEASVSPMDADTTLWVARDVTERRQKEQELRSTNQELEAAHQELKRMFEHEQVLARTDSLTGLNNRRYFFELATREFIASLRYRRPLSIILFDVDGFKQANDTFGHAMGDTILMQITQAAASQVRGVDVLARYGGDEFIILLPQTAIQQALAVAERVRTCVAAARAESDNGPVSATISVGVAEMIHTPQDQSVEAAIRRADQALYAAKARGGNQTVTYPME
ncbi:MAG: PAS domain S-box protein [Chloroflexi bacterium]|nr:PAS domain S-box protein [Chloroflexota bacterium]